MNSQKWENDEIISCEQLKMSLDSVIDGYLLDYYYGQINVKMLRVDFCQTMTSLQFVNKYRMKVMS